MTNKIFLLVPSIVKLYTDDKMSVSAIATHFKINLKTVRRVLKEQNVEVRKAKKNILGNIYGNLTVVKYVKADINKKSIWECKCSCGGTTYVRTSDLISGKVRSCGCIYATTSANNLKKAHAAYPRSYGFKGIEDIRGAYISSIKHGAMKRKIEYNLTKEYLWELYIKQNKKCALTGLDIKFSKKYESSSEATASLDRINSELGYIDGNVQWVHKDLNNMKQHYTMGEFVNYCRLVVEHLKPEYR